MTPDLTTRIERAARALKETYGLEIWMPGAWECIFRAADPGLYTSPPSMWLAPWEATPEMIMHALSLDSISGLGGVYSAMRDAFLSQSKDA